MSGDDENARKIRRINDEEDDEGLLNLSLSLRSSVSPSALPPPPPQAAATQHHRNYAGPTGSKPARARRNQAQAQESETIVPPFPWATNKRATVHSLAYLEANQIHRISGKVHCKKCDVTFDLEFDLREKFAQIGTYIAETKYAMHERAPVIWINPVLPNCNHCHDENCVKPVIPEDKDAINWLFLLLGQMLGCCTLEQLKYFCKYTENHRTGAKDRVLYLTYLGVCKQLDPSGPFDR